MNEIKAVAAMKDTSSIIIEGDSKVIFKLLICERYFVRLNLINHFVGFIPAKFAYILAFNNPVFR